MREFLLELYLQHGERGFAWKYKGDKITPSLGTLLEKDFIIYQNQNKYDITKRIQFHLSPKAIEYIKNLDNP